MKVGWYFHRLRAMTVSELVHRVAERWKHRSDASFAESLRDIELGAAAEGAIHLPPARSAPESLKQALARDAASLLRGEWRLFGWRELNVGLPPQWNRDATCGVEISGTVLSHELDHRALPGGADARTIWEINRWSEMVRLAMHGRVNGDADAIRVAMNWLEDWCDKNPVGHGINWTSPLEAGLRLMNFVWFDALLEGLADANEGTQNAGAGPLSAIQLAQQTLRDRVVPAHAVWVWRYRSFGSSANNHLLGELVGLLHAVRRWPALEKVVCPADRLWHEISGCVLEQFAEDGGNKEQALHYHLFAWEMAWHAARLMRVTDGPVIERLRKAAEFFVNVAHDAEQWEYGDNDDAQIVPVTLAREHAVAEWRSWMRGEDDPRVGETSLGFWLGAAPVPGGQSSSAASGWWTAHISGMAVCNLGGWKVRLDASPLGFGAMAAHGHCDALHLSLWDGPQALVIDPGTGGYFSERKLRSELAAWTAHNGPVPLAGFETPRRAGTFLLVEHHAAPTLEVKDNAAQAGLVHESHSFTRNVQVSGESVLVTDRELHGRPFTVAWLLHPECQIEQLEGGDDLALRIKRAGLRWHVSFGNLTESLPRLVRTVVDVSPAFGLKQDGWMLELSSNSGVLQTVWRRD